MYHSQLSLGDNVYSIPVLYFRVHVKSLEMSRSKNKIFNFDLETSKFIWTGIIFHLIYFYLRGTHFGKYWISDWLTKIVKKNYGQVIYTLR